MTDLMGYCERWSAAPGECLRFMVSCIGADSYRADIVRLMSADAGPKATPFREEVADVAVNGTYPARDQALYAGSWAVVPEAPALAGRAGVTLQAMIWPSRPRAGRQALFGTYSERARAGIGLGIGEDGALELRLGDGDSVVAVSSGVPLLARQWYFVAAAFDREAGTATLTQEPVAGGTFTVEPAVHIEHPVAIGPAAGPGPITFAAWHTGSTGRPGPGRDLAVGCHFNGKIDRPRLAARALDRAEMAALGGAAVPEALADVVLAAWDFGRDIGTENIRDLTAARRDGVSVNLPARAVTGHNWDATEMAWMRAPEQYGAIHFHDDDIDDAGWEADFTLRLPADMRSGAYAARLRAGEAEFHIAFFVRPPRGVRTAKVAYLASTATYTVYINHLGRFLGTWVEPVQGRLTVVDAIDGLLLKYPGLGRSTYDVHADGSGVAYASPLRPATNVRPTGRMWNYCEDMFVIDWLERSRHDYDTITDDDLHREGLALLEGYGVVVTGSHPEYYSREMLDAMDAYVRRGGRLMYLGGNGFYWRIAYHPTKPGVIEVRRAEDGTRAWASEMGEYYHSFTGEYGGLWRRQQRAPNKLAGIGFISQGFDASSYYRRTAASNDPRCAFIFEGIDEEILGDFGMLQGGAAGIELDCADRRLGTPRHALVVASSENHSNTYELVNEEINVGHGATDAVLNDDIRADMVFFETPHGGAVFSVGSIAYAGSLVIDAMDNNIARLTTNVLDRFVDPAPFAMPEHAP